MDKMQGNTKGIKKINCEVCGYKPVKESVNDVLTFTPQDYHRSVSKMNVWDDTDNRSYFGSHPNADISNVMVTCCLCSTHVQDSRCCVGNRSEEFTGKSNFWWDIENEYFDKDQYLHDHVCERYLEHKRSSESWEPQPDMEIIIDRCKYKFHKERMG